VFKIDNEFKGRGTAYFDISHLKILEELRKKKIEATAEYIDTL